MFSDFIHLALKALSSLYLYLSALFLLLYLSGYTLFEELIDFVFFFFSFLIDAHSLKKRFVFWFFICNGWGMGASWPYFPGFNNEFAPLA